ITEMEIQSILLPIVEYVSVVFIIFGGVLPYIPQYIQIKNTGNCDGFSLYVCLALLLANILRILFWFCKRFELPLLAQSFVMLAAMLAMVHISVASKRQQRRIALPTEGGSRKSAGGNLESPQGGFWNWPDFSSYAAFLLLFSAVAGFVSFALSGWPAYVELLGLAAVLTEAMLAVPQFHRNRVNKSTAGMSVAMVALWTSGDLFKTAYFVLRSAPAQFWLCGLLQIGIDLAIFGQVFAYQGRKE
ncbi:hypothetical protein BOX15_Mlig024989g2, partial [Macrostomum lignano]